MSDDPLITITGRKRKRRPESLLAGAVDPSSSSSSSAGAGNGVAGLGGSSSSNSQSGSNSNSNAAVASSTLTRLLLGGFQDPVADGAEGRPLGSEPRLRGHHCFQILADAAGEHPAAGPTTPRRLEFRTSAAGACVLLEGAEVTRLEWLVETGAAVRLGQPLVKLEAERRPSAAAVSLDTEGGRVTTVICSPAEARLQSRRLENLGQLLEAAGRTGAAAPAQLQALVLGELCAHHIRRGSHHSETKVCAVCGSLLPSGDYPGQPPGAGLRRQSSLSPLIMDGLEVHLTSQYRPVLVSQRTAQLRANQRLVLVFDIDHTLLHATRDPMAVFYRQHPGLRADTHSFRVEGDPKTYTVKLRPGLREMLEALRTKYDFFLYTMGTRGYAEKIRQIIDPSHTFFRNMVTRDELEKLILTPEERADPHKLRQLLPRLHKDLDVLLPVDSSHIVVLDDRTDVWGRMCGQVVYAYPFHWFDGLDELYDRSGQTAFVLPKDAGERKEADGGAAGAGSGQEEDETGEDDDSALLRLQIPGDLAKVMARKVQEPEDTCLRSVTSALLALHALMYPAAGAAAATTAPGDPPEGSSHLTTESLLRSMRKSTLSEVSVCFSGLLQRGSPASAQGVWKLAQEFGARCYEDLRTDQGQGPGRAAAVAPAPAPAAPAVDLGQSVASLGYSGLDEDSAALLKQLQQSLANQQAARPPPPAPAAKEFVSHLVVADLGTQKVQEARRLVPRNSCDLGEAAVAAGDPDLWIVHLTWLKHATTHFQRSPERLFLPGRQLQGRVAVDALARHCETPITPEALVERVRAFRREHNLDPPERRGWEQRRALRLAEQQRAAAQLQQSLQRAVERAQAVLLRSRVVGIASDPSQGHHHHHHHHHHQQQQHPQQAQQPRQQPHSARSFFADSDDDGSERKRQRQPAAAAASSSSSSAPQPSSGGPPPAPAAAAPERRKLAADKLFDSFLAGDQELLEADEMERQGGGGRSSGFGRFGGDSDGDSDSEGGDGGLNRLFGAEDDDEDLLRGPGAEDLSGGDDDDEDDGGARGASRGSFRDLLFGTAGSSARSGQSARKTGGLGSGSGSGAGAMDKALQRMQQLNREAQLVQQTKKSGASASEDAGALEGDALEEFLLSEFD